MFNRNVLTSSVSAEFMTDAKRKFQVVEGGRDKTKISVPSNEVRSSIYDRLIVHGHRLRQVARSVGVDDNEAVSILVDVLAERSEKQIRAARIAGYREFQLRMFGGAPVAMRLAA